MAAVEIGRRLREARELQGLGLDVVAAELEVAVEDLSAIESDRVDLFPNDAARRAAIARYAKYVGISPHSLEAAKAAASSEPAPDEPGLMRPLAHGAPSQVALAVASGSLELAVLQVRGVRESVERLGVGHEPSERETIALWTFAQQARDAAQTLNAESVRLAQLLVRGFLTHDGEWPLTKEEQKEYHEVLAALAAREAQSHGPKFAHSEE